MRAQSGSRPTSTTQKVDAKGLLPPAAPRRFYSGGSWDGPGSSTSSEGIGSGRGSPGSPALSAASSSTGVASDAASAAAFLSSFFSCFCARLSARSRSRWILRKVCRFFATDNRITGGSECPLQSLGGAWISSSAGSPRRSSRLRSASAFTSAPKSNARPLSHSHVSMMITAPSEPHALLYEENWLT